MQCNKVWLLLKLINVLKLCKLNIPNIKHSEKVDFQDYMSDLKVVKQMEQTLVCAA